MYKASISLHTGTRPVISFVFNGLLLSLDYRTRGFDVAMGSNESIDNVDELMMLVIHQQSRHDIEVPPSRSSRPLWPLFPPIAVFILCLSVSRLFFSPSAKINLYFVFDFHSFHTLFPHIQPPFVFLFCLIVYSSYLTFRFFAFAFLFPFTLFVIASHCVASSFQSSYSVYFNLHFCHYFSSTIANSLPRTIFF